MTHPDKAREAAARKLAYLTGEWESTCRSDSDAAIDAFLAASVPADVGEIAQRVKRAQLHENESISFKTGDATLLLDTIALLAAQLTAQKAAHAKLLRDEAERFYKNTHWETAAALRFLADMIEGGK